jgi:hypothetical protein
MPITTSTLRRLLLLLVCAAAVASLIALTGGGTAQSEDAPSAPPQASPTPPYVQPSAAVVDAREAAFEDQFALLREPGGEAIPASTHISDAALDIGASRQLSPPPAARLTGEDEVEQPESMVFVTPRADGSQCLLAVEPDTHGPHQTCAFPDQAVDGYFLMTADGTDGGTEIYGLLPDGVDEVAVELADGSSVTLPVILNGYMARFGQPTASISWTDGNSVPHSLETASDPG